MRSAHKRVFFRNYIFDVWEEVYEPAEDSFLFAENLEVKEGDFVLDMGTGCGILGVIAAEKASAVVAVDINPYAVRCAKENAEQNKAISKMLFIQGDLFSPFNFNVKFDLILFNAPYLPTEPNEGASWAELAWAGGCGGREVIDRFIRAAPKYVKRDGRIFLMQSTLTNVKKTIEGFAKEGLKTSILARRSLPFFEALVLVKAEK